MARMTGADADALDLLASQFDQVADQLDREAGALSGILNNISWLGDAAGRYVSDWTGFQLPKINLSTRFLRDQAAGLRAQAAEQRQASTASSGSLFYADRVPGTPFWPLSWMPGDALLPDVPWGWLSHLDVSLGGLIDAITFDVNGTLRDLNFGSLWFGALGAAGGVLEDLFREQGWTAAALAAGFTGVIGGAGAAVMTFAQALKNAPLGKVGPALAIVGGVTGFVSEYNATLKEGAGTGSLLKMSGDLITVAGGVAMLIPGGQVVGAGLMVAGTAANGVGWVVNNWDDITETAANTYRAVDNWVDDRVDDVVDAAVDAGNAVVDYAGDAVDSATELIGSGWNKVRSLF